MRSLRQSITLNIPVGAVERLEDRRLMAVVVDADFGSAGGFAYDEPADLPTQLLSVAPAPGGQIWVGGSIGSGTSKKPMLLRVNADGTLDQAFNSGTGRLIINSPSTASGITEIKPRTGGGFTLAGGSAVIRITEAGRLDGTFGGGDGVVPIASPTVAINASGAFYVADDQNIRRYSSTGILDNGWGTAGAFNYRKSAPLAPFFAESDKPDRIITLNSAGRVMMALDGAFDESGAGLNKIGVFRLTATGQLDDAFSGDGVAFAGFSGDVQRLAGFTSLPDGRSVMLLDEDDGIASVFAFSGSGASIAIPQAQSGMLALSQPFEPAGLYATADNQTLIFGSGVEDDEIVDGNPLFSSVFRLTSTFAVDTTFSTAADGFATIAQASAESADSGEPAIAATELPDGTFVVLTDRVAGDTLVRLDEPAAPAVTLVNRRLTVRGTAANETVRITPLRRGVSVVINGQTFAFNERRHIALDIDLGAGDDALVIDAGLGTISNSIVGGEGNDSITTFDDGATASTRRVDAGDGNDTVKIAFGASIIRGGAGNDVLYGSTADDAIFGGDGNDFVVGGAGNDYLEGNVGHDTMDGSAGDDRLLGHQGSDILIGGKGDDTLYGMAGDDTLAGNTGADYLDAGAGNDRLESRDNVIDQLFGGGDDDAALLDAIDARDGIETIV